MSDPAPGQVIPLARLARTLGLGGHEHVAVVGGGGKTTTLHALADQLPGSSVVTTTTKMGHDQHRGRPLLLAPTDEELAAATSRDHEARSVVAWRGIVGTKALGVHPEDCDRWFGLVDHVLVEADGARRRPFKAPGPMEPVVPASATALLVVMGADALGRVIGDQCHRPLRVAALAGCRPYERLTPDRAATVLLHERGFAAARPAGAAMAIVVTKVSESNRWLVDRLDDELATRRAQVPDLGDVALVRIGAIANGGEPTGGGQP